VEAPERAKRVVVKKPPPKRAPDDKQVSPPPAITAPVCLVLGDARCFWCPSTPHHNSQKHGGPQTQLPPPLHTVCAQAAATNPPAKAAATLSPTVTPGAAKGKALGKQTHRASWHLRAHDEGGSPLHRQHDLAHDLAHKERHRAVYNDDVKGGGGWLSSVARWSALQWAKTLVGVSLLSLLAVDLSGRCVCGGCGCWGGASKLTTFGGC
jgi:hypothetical protein